MQNKLIEDIFRIRFFIMDKEFIHYKTENTLENDEKLYEVFVNIKKDYFDYIEENKILIILFDNKKEYFYKIIKIGKNSDSKYLLDKKFENIKCMFFNINKNNINELYEKDDIKEKFNYNTKKFFETNYIICELYLNSNLENLKIHLKSKKSIAGQYVEKDDFLLYKKLNKILKHSFYKGIDTFINENTIEILHNTVFFDFLLKPNLNLT